MDRLEVFKIIALQASKGELTFPANVKATLKLQEALDDPDCHIEAAARMVMAEPLLSARVVALANSAAYNRSGNEIANVRAAVSRLGFATLKSMVASVIVRQLGSQISDPALKRQADQLWQHSAHVASLSHVIAKRVSRVDPETAMFAGIVHQVGGFYLLSRAHEFPGLLDDGADEWMEHGEVAIGRGVLRRLGVPKPVMEAIEALWIGMRALPPENLGDTLILASDLTTIPSPLQRQAGASGLQSAATIDFTIGEGTLAAVLAESAAEIASLSAALA